MQGAFEEFPAVGGFLGRHITSACPRSGKMSTPQRITEKCTQERAERLATLS
jgi:hypothetical protein